jgi:hypothetical protein
MILTSLTSAAFSTKAATNDNPHSKITPGEMIAILLVFILELAFFIWALTLAVRCGRKREDMFLHVLFAFFFPIIYVLYYFISGC